MVAESRGVARDAQGLVVACRVEDEFAEQRAIFGHDANVPTGDQEGDGLVLVRASDGDVAEAAEVAQGHGAVGVGPVLADAEVGGRRRAGGASLEAVMEGNEGGAAAESAVWPPLVVVGAEGVE